MLVEDEDFLSELVLEYHVRVEHIMRPDKVVKSSIGRHLLKVLNVHDEALGLAKGLSLVEDYLLVVREQLCVPAEVLLHSPAARNVH